jgi:hypothetical protein
VGIASKENRIEKRLLFVGEISFFVTIPFLLRYWLGDQLLSYILSLTLVGLLLLFLHHRKFKI